MNQIIMKPYNSIILSILNLRKFLTVSIRVWLEEQELLYKFFLKGFHLGIRELYNYCKSPIKGWG